MTWFISQLELRAHQLAGAEYGLVPLDAVGVYAETTCVANAINLVEQPAEGVQLSVCDACGVEHCNQNDRAVLRRAGEFVVLAPDFSAMQEAFPDARVIEPLNTRELARILQLEAPDDLLGSFPDLPCVDRDAVVAVSSGATAEQIARLNTQLERFFADRAALRFEPTIEPAKIEFFVLDNSALKEWPIPLLGDSFLADPRHLVVPVHA
jgi:hypothetical protein